MSIFVLLMYIFLNLRAADGKSYYEKAHINLDSPGTCFNDDYSQSLSRGQRLQLGSCEYLQCIMMDADLFWVNHKCDVIFPSSDCKVVQDDEAVYPACCPKQIC